MLKKLLYCSAALALMVSCNEDFDDWAKPQSNEQEDLQSVVALANTDTLAINLNEVEEDSVQVVSFDYEMPQGYQFEQYVAKIVFSQNNENEELQTTSFEIPVSDDGKVAKSDLQSIITRFYGKRPVERQADLNVYAKLFTDASKKTAVISNTISIPLVVTPEAATIASAYYLVGDMLTWDANGMQQFSHSDEDVYDDPVFTIVFTTTADNQYWKIIPQTNIDNGDFWANPGVVGVAVDGDTSTEGELVNDGANAGKIETAGKYRMTINMVDFTYKIEPVMFENFVYFIGATDGWSASDQKLALQNQDGLYTGYVYCADPNGWGNQFKFQRVAGSWDNEINSATFSSITGDFGTVDGNTNIEAKEGEGVYYVMLNLGELTLNAQKVNTMGVVGDFNGWGDDFEMTWNADEYCFEATGVDATTAGWKFRVNYDWAINLGGDTDNLYNDGSNLWIDANNIKFYPTRKDNDNIYCVVE